MRKILLPILATVSLAACAHNHAPAEQGHHHHHHAHDHTHHHDHKHPIMTHTLESKYTFTQTVQKLTQAVQSKGMTVFATIDHAAAAKQVGLNMQPATVIVFGTPKAGTPLMVKDPALALQLPLRVLVTEVDGKVQVVFNDTRAIIHGSKIEYSEVENTLANAEKLIRSTVTQ
ncbi:Uncharacterized conserved protein [Alysiella crassa]|uniref:Uncharacterized conserved protein n=1 Tax=Alysiella crassa TaxID=153491 RepID=A0A376BMN5_9NEIS|nr:DUF302 domain-containing protein [Alysiella crassa]UOP06943.1 DUF302 domain-containing protein [Alysiella crassa]SSY70920.1 Uncharacterized conserved protein [Alysiella crassa]